MCDITVHKHIFNRYTRIETYVHAHVNKCSGDILP